MDVENVVEVGFIPAPETPEGCSPSLPTVLFIGEHEGRHIKGLRFGEWMIWLAPEESAEIGAFLVSE